VKKTSAQGTSLYPFGDDYEVTNGVVTKYVSVAGLGVVAKRVDSRTYWMHTDRLGSIQAITDNQGAQVWRKTYRPYGETITESTSHQESRGWIDQRQDNETGLTYLHARYYDPTGPGGGNGPPTTPPQTPTTPPDQCPQGVASCEPEPEPEPEKPEDPKPPCAATSLMNGIGYADANLTGGSHGFVGSIGGQFTRNAVFPYAGLGVGTPGVSGSVQASLTGGPTQGWNFGLQVTVPLVPVSFQGGGAGGSPFFEVGAGGPPGASLTAYYVAPP
jgi:hypothetical protein